MDEYPAQLANAHTKGRLLRDIRPAHHTLYKELTELYRARAKTRAAAGLRLAPVQDARRRSLGMETRSHAHHAAQSLTGLSVH